MEKKTKMILIVISVLLGIFSISFLKSNLSLRANLRKASIKQEVEIKEQVALRTRESRKAIKRDLEEKYRADQVSYRVMAQRLELEKEKREELEDRFNIKVQKEERE